jgi:hypothetical protein
LDVFGRYLLSLLIKAAPTVGHPKFYEFWMKRPFQNFDADITDQYRLTQTEFDTYSDKEKQQYDLAALSDGKYFNKAHRQMVFDKYLQKRFAAGMTGGGGLEYLETLNIDPANYYNWWNNYGD